MCGFFSFSWEMYGSANTEPLWLWRLGAHMVPAVMNAWGSRQSTRESQNLRMQSSIAVCRASERWLTEKQTCIHFQRECPATHWVLLSLNTLFPKRGQQYLQKPVFTYSCSPRTRTLLVMSGCCNDSPVINNATLLPGFSQGETLGRRHR